MKSNAVAKSMLASLKGSVSKPILHWMISALHGWQSTPISLSALKGFLGFDPQPKSTEIFSAVSMGW
jgi:hypothetical protein